MSRLIQFALSAGRFGLAVAMVLLPCLGHTQPLVSGSGFKIPGYYEPPNGTQMKFMLEGAQGQQSADKRIHVQQAKYRTWRVTGEAEMVAEAPECTYDPKLRTISSPGPLRVQTADGKFSIEGEGFEFQQTNSTLVVSNRIHTTIRSELLNRAPGAAGVTNAEAPPEAGVHVYSEKFEYSMKTGVAVYEKNVRVTGTNLNSTAGKLTVVMPVDEHRLKSITAEEDVVIDYEALHATGKQAVYSDETGLIEMTGQPTWRVDQRQGSGDELVLDQTNRVFYARGHAKMELPAQSMGGSGFMAGHAPSAEGGGGATNHLVEIQCANYEIRTNQAVFREDVQVDDRAADQLRGRMTCELMTLTFSGTNEFQKMIAERRVVIGQADNQFTGERAEYTGTNGVLDLTGNPAWRAGVREGSGDVVRVNPAREEMLVKGNAVMKLPAAELGQSALTAVGKPKSSETVTRTNEFAVIRSQEYFVTPDSALFQGGVRLEHPQMQWVCPEVTMLSPPELGKDGHVIIAEPGVVFDVVDDQGRKFHGTGDKAVFTHRVTPVSTNDFVVLTGKPAVLQSTNFTGRNNVMTLDLANHKLTAPGHYTVWVAMPEGAAAALESRKLKLTP